MMTVWFAVFGSVCLSFVSAEVPSPVAPQRGVPSYLERFPMTVHGDILVPAELMSSLLTASNTSDIAQRDFFVGGPSLRGPRLCPICGTTWDFDATSKTYPVPYVFDEDFNKAEQKIVMEVLSLIELHSAVRFLPRTTQADFITFHTDLRGCQSVVGKAGGEQVVLLQRVTGPRSTCITRGTILHEVLHALGFIHQHQRPDRDQYLAIHLENIADGHFTDFELTRYARDEGPFDYASVMLYGRLVFSKNKLPTHDAINVENVVATNALIDAERVDGSSCDWAALRALYPGDGSGQQQSCDPGVLPATCAPTELCPLPADQCGTLCLYHCASGAAQHWCRVKNVVPSRAERHGVVGLASLILIALLS